MIRMLFILKTSDGLHNHSSFVTMDESPVMISLASFAGFNHTKF